MYYNTVISYYKHVEQSSSGAAIDRYRFRRLLDDFTRSREGEPMRVHYERAHMQLMWPHAHAHPYLTMAVGREM
jgi:hypothetical protein